MFCQVFWNQIKVQSCKIISIFENILVLGRFCSLSIIIHGKYNSRKTQSRQFLLNSLKFIILWNLFGLKLITISNTFVKFDKESVAKTVDSVLERKYDIKLDELKITHLNIFYLSFSKPVTIEAPVSGPSTTKTSWPSSPSWTIPAPLWKGFVMLWKILYNKDLMKDKYLGQFKTQVWQVYSQPWWNKDCW